MRHNGHNPSQPTALISPEQQAQADAIVQRLLAPFIAELGAVCEELGRERALREATEREAAAAEAARLTAERERDALRARPSTMVDSPHPARGSLTHACSR